MITCYVITIVSYLIVIDFNQNVHGEVHFGYDNLLCDNKIIYLIILSYFIAIDVNQNVYEDIRSKYNYMLCENAIIYTFKYYVVGNDNMLCDNKTIYIHCLWFKSERTCGSTFCT